MDEETFWRLIEDSKAERIPELSDQAAILQQKLELLPGSEIIDFQSRFQNLLNGAFRWDLWAAAYIIEGGCSDDGFEYFRAGLIGLGRQAYCDALNDPETLANQPTCGVDFSQEDLLYAALKAYSTVSGTEMPRKIAPISRDPKGEPWDEDRVAEKYPKLAERFGFA